MSDVTTRLKKVINWLIFKEIAENERALADLLGYTKSSFSQIVNGKVPLSDKFLKSICALDKNINDVWIKTGNGDMLVRPINQSVNGDNNTQIAGNNNHIALPSTLDRAINEIAEQRKLVSKAQEQIDRLITLLERK